MVVFWGVGGGNINLHFRTVNVNISDEIKIQIYKKNGGDFCDLNICILDQLFSQLEIIESKINCQNLCQHQIILTLTKPYFNQHNLTKSTNLIVKL